MPLDTLQYPPHIAQHCAFSVKQIEHLREYEKYVALYDECMKRFNACRSDDIHAQLVFCREAAKYKHAIEYLKKEYKVHLKSEKDILEEELSVLLEYLAVSSVYVIPILPC